MRAVEKKLSNNNQNAVGGRSSTGGPRGQRHTNSCAGHAQWRSLAGFSFCRLYCSYMAEATWLSTMEVAPNYSYSPEDDGMLMAISSISFTNCNVNGFTRNAYL